MGWSSSRCFGNFGRGAFRYFEGFFHGAIGPFAGGARSLDVLADLVSRRELAHRHAECGSERFQYAFFTYRDGREAFRGPRVECPIQDLDLGGVGEVAFVVLEYHRYGRGIDAVAEEVLRHLLQTLEVFLKTIGCRIRDEDDGIRPLEQHLSGGRIETLAGNGDDLKA